LFSVFLRIFREKDLEKSQGESELKIPTQLRDEILKKLETILKFFDYSDIDRKNLRFILEKIGEIPTDIFTEFYNHLLSFEETNKILENADIKLLKKKQKKYFEDVLKAEIDIDYIRERIKLGVVHYEKNVKLEHYIGSYAKYLTLLVEYISNYIEDRELKYKLLSLIKGFLFDMYMVIQSYSYIDQEKYRKLYKRYAELFNSINDGIIIVEVDSFRIKNINKKIEEWLLYKKEDLMDRDISSIFLEETKIKNILRERFERYPVLYMKNKRGEIIPVELSLSFSLSEGKLYAFVTVRNIKFRLEAEKQINRISKLYSVLSDVNQLITKVKDKETLFNKIGEILVEKGEFDSVLFVKKGEGRYKPFSFATREDISLEKFYRKNVNYLDEVFEEKKVIRKVSEDGERILIPIFKKNDELLKNGEEIFAVMIIFSRDITVFKDEEIRLFEEISGDISFAISSIERNQKIHFLEYFDILTKLPNRRYLFDEIGRLIEDKNSRFALLIVDINRFKNINETLGYSRGDILIKEFANRLRNCCENENTILARVGGDEFGLIIKDVSKKEDILDEIERIKDTVREPFLIEDQKIYMSINTGVAFYPQDGKTKEELVAAAEAALKEAKKSGVNTFEIYSPLMKKENLEFLTLENELRNAIKNEEFRLFFQPVIELRTGKIVGAEALLRWFSPKRGLVSPLTFIPILEETSLIHEVGDFIFYEAAKYAKKWEKTGIYISVNISPSQVVFGNLLETVIRSIESFNLDPSKLVVELTETVLMENLDKSREEIERLNRYGIKMFIDDFGTGYSSLSYLKKLPFYAVKIDRSFIKDIPENEDDIKISKAIINLAHSLDKKVVAEGIETKEQLEYMKTLDCDFGQGYLFSKPVSSEEFDKLLRSMVIG